MRLPSAIERGGAVKARAQASFAAKDLHRSVAIQVTCKKGHRAWSMWGYIFQSLLNS